MREVPQRLASPSEETPKKKKKKNQISVSITLSNSILNCSTLALFTASAGSLFHIGAVFYVKIDVIIRRSCENVGLNAFWKSDTLCR